MTEVQVVPIEFIHVSWSKIEPHLTSGLQRSGGEYTADHIKLYALQGAQTILVAVDGDDITGAASIQFINYPNERVAFVTSIGGKMLANKDIWSQFESWCKSMGASKVQGAAFESVARLWRMAFGVEKKYVIVEKTL